MAGQEFSPGTPVSNTNKTGRHDITEILLKVAINTLTYTCSGSVEFPWILVHSINYIDVRDIAEMLIKLTLNNYNRTLML